MRILSLLVCSLLSLSASAEWQLNNKDSQLNFISIKKNSIAEVHHFKKLSGSIDKSGAAKLVIALASVETHIPIRNERMQAALFETSTFAKATFTTTIDVAFLSALTTGDSKELMIAGELDLHGSKQKITSQVLVTKKASGEVQVATIKPIIINAIDYSLIDGINKLQKLAKLPSIALAVPVSFQLTFSQ
ncbi:MAG: YceI family protein [Thalassotalea sp.]